MYGTKFKRLNGITEKKTCHIALFLAVLRQTQHYCYPGFVLNHISDALNSSVMIVGNILLCDSLKTSYWTLIGHHCPDNPCKWRWAHCNWKICPLCKWPPYWVRTNGLLFLDNLIHPKFQFPHENRCYKIKLVKVVNTDETQFHPCSRMNGINAS